MTNLINSVFLFSPLRENNKKCDKTIDYGQVSYNLKDFLLDLTINLASVELILVQRFISFIDPEFIKKCIIDFTKLKAKE